MNRDNFTFRPAFKLTIVGNHKPVFRTVDNAQRRRFNLAPFIHRPAAPDRRLEQKLQAEWPAILKWAIEGCADWQANGLIRPSSVLLATEQYFADQDLIGQRIAEECDAERGNKWKSAASAALFASWTSYANRAGEKPGLRKPFAGELERRGVENKKGTGGIREFLGIRLKPRPVDSGAGGAYWRDYSVVLTRARRRIPPIFAPLRASRHSAGMVREARTRADAFGACFRRLLSLRANAHTGTARLAREIVGRSCRACWRAGTCGVASDAPCGDGARWRAWRPLVWADVPS